MADSLKHILSKGRKLILLPFNLVRFKYFHYSATVKKSMKITPRYITINKNVFIEKNCRIEAVTSYNDTCFHPSIVFEENVSVQQNLHLTCASQITIGRNTAIASNVSITDIHHPYDDINTPIEQQDIITKPVTIGSDSKIYNNTVILPGVHIGKHCTIGANSVVTRDIPDYSVAVGAPARVVKQYNFETKQWEKK